MTMFIGVGRQQVVAARRNAAVLQPILTILENKKLPGSLEFSGSCDLQNFPDLPRLRKPSATDEASALEGLRSVFADNPEMHVGQDLDGAIRITESGVPTDILRVTISHILFQDFDQNDIYNPNDALRVVLRAPELLNFMEEHGIEMPSGADAVPGNSGRWSPERPHISGALDNVTLSQALDYILKTFPGIWVYESCQKSGKTTRLVYFRFFFLRRVGSRIFVEE